MTDNIKHTTIPRCKFNNSGYCKYGNQCKERHFDKICSNSKCKKVCNARHPKICKYEQNCKFLRQGNCAYKHATLTNHYDEQLMDLEKTINTLQKENKVLKEKIKIVQTSLTDEISKTEVLKSDIKDLEMLITKKVEMINKLNQENEQ